MVAPLIKRTPIQSVVKGQIPEHIREDYPTFVAFVEAYYDYMQRNGVNLKQFRDIDTTLDEFIVQFKKELAHNLPIVVEDERFLLSRIKDQYLAKGSEASYKLLFKLIYGKNVELLYPGRQMLIASDGRWNQEISVFAQVDYGDPDDIVGKLVDIQTGGRILRVLIDRKEQLIGEIDRIVKIGKTNEIFSTATLGSTAITVSTAAGIERSQLVTGYGIQPETKVVSVVGNIVNISKPTIEVVNNNLIYSSELYEFFLDKRFFGRVFTGDLIRFKDSFQATIVSATQTLEISQPGKNFRIGQVFELRSGAGTGALMKVTGVDANGGIKYAELIKFGLGYTADFALSLLATNDVVSTGTVNVVGTSTLTKNNTYQSSTLGTISATPTSTSVTGTGTSFGAVGNVQIGDEIWTTEATPRFIGVVKTIASTTSLTLYDTPQTHTPPYQENGGGEGITTAYSGSYVFRNNRGVGSLYTFLIGGVPTQAINYQPTLIDRTEGFNEQGYINRGDYVTWEYVDATYAGTLVREFSLNYKNAQTDADEPAIVSITLGALVRYPGFFETNNGFLSDSIYIQDSRFYQAFSYVIKIDERLASYKSAVKTMLHPSGTALFGEFQITNEYDLSLQLESLVKSLGIGLEDEFTVSEDGITYYLTKGFVDTLDLPTEYLTHQTTKALAHSTTPTDSAAKNFGKFLDNTTINYNGVVESHFVTMQSTSTTKNFGKGLTTSYSGATDAISQFTIGKSLSDAPVVTDVPALTINKVVTPDTLPAQTEEGYIGLNSYFGQDYVIFADTYSIDSRYSTFTTP